MTSYRTFWVVCGLYFLTLGFGAASGMEFLKWLANLFDNFGEKLNIARIPLYHFPDVWLNLIWFGGLLKVVLAIMVVISITNEFTYRTLRQNIIDGLSRTEFLISKILTNVLLSLMSVAMIFLIGLVTGMIYSPSIEINQIFTDLEFFPGLFPGNIFLFVVCIDAGYFDSAIRPTIIFLLLSQMIESIITANIDDYVPWIDTLFSNAIDMEFNRISLCHDMHFRRSETTHFCLCDNCSCVDRLRSIISAI